MNSLPSSRQIINGRTFDRRWNPADFDPISRVSRRVESFWSVLLASGVGVFGAWALFYWWSM